MPPVDVPESRIDHHRIPPEILVACQRLHDAGFGTYLVGGAVRDLLRSPTAKAKDFDLTTAARPEQVIEVFGRRRTIPTGIDHGTVTVMCEIAGEKSASPHPVEITTFRGETGFTDGRRPDHVEFITDLTEDLRRRDFTINAIAYDPLRSALIDPFDGRKDLQNRILRAVGDPVARFGEDGLRVMRAVRFAAQLEFALDPATRAAFAGALPTLRKVSRERVRDELLKLLNAARPARALRLMVERSDEDPTADWGDDGCLLTVVLPEVAAMLKTPEQAKIWWWLVELVAPAARLGAVLWPMRGLTADEQAKLPRLDDLLDERLKLPARHRQHLIGLLQLPLPASTTLPDAPSSPPLDELLRSDVAVRRLLARHPFELLDELLQLGGLELLLTAQTERGDQLLALRDRLHAERARHPPLSIGELVISGKDLMTELGLRPGPQIGQLLGNLLEAVLVAPARNERATLLELARQILSPPA
jgi:tRNA nucleotidyltransferase (CCA-adding enzyme)